MTMPRTVDIYLAGGARDGWRAVINRDLFHAWSDTTPHPSTGLWPRRYHYEWFGRYALHDHTVRVYEFVGETAVGERLHPAGQGGTA